MLHSWRRLVLRAFGAKLAVGTHIYPSARVWAPWNLRMDSGACLASGVECYNVDMVWVGENAIVSQRSHLCTASHDINHFGFALVSSPIHLGRNAWICTEAFVGPGVTVGDGAVVAARAVIVRDVPPCAIMAGNPARRVGTRDGVELAVDTASVGQSASNR